MDPPPQTLAAAPVVGRVLSSPRRVTPPRRGRNYVFVRVAREAISRDCACRAPRCGDRRADRGRDGPPHPSARQLAGVRNAAVPEPAPADQPARAGPALAHDAGREDRPDDAGRAGQCRHRHVEDHHRQPRQRAVRRRVGADAEHADGVGGHGRPLPECGAGHAAAHPNDLRHRHRPRRREHVRRDGVPAQHRARRHP